MPVVLPRLGRRQAAVAVVMTGVIAGMTAAGIGAGSSAPHAQMTFASGRTNLQGPARNDAQRPPLRRPVRVATGARTHAVNCRRVQCVALTFDDGPDRHTDQLLRTLRGAHMYATFFMLGIQVQKFPSVARHVAAAGEEIGDHTWDHRDLTSISPNDARVEIARARTEIAHVIGRLPALFRPPYGATNAQLARVAGGLGMPVILWNVDPLDWRDRIAPLVAQRAVSAARPGSIILLHDIYPSTVDAVPAIIKGLRQRGFTLVTVSQLLGSTRPGQTVFSR